MSRGTPFAGPDCGRVVEDAVGPEPDRLLAGHNAHFVLDDGPSARQLVEILLNGRTVGIGRYVNAEQPRDVAEGHLRNEREHLFTFLTQPGVQATNWRAEQALRPAIVNRRNWGGNRTKIGARNQQTVISVTGTARQQGLDPLDVMTAAQHNPAVSELIKLPARASPPPTALTA